MLSTAPYKQINTKVTDVVTSSGQTMKDLSCQSVGYPKAEVTWLSNSGNISAINNISYIYTAEGLFNITSVIRISSEANKTFTCIFWNNALQNSSSQYFTFPGMHTFPLFVFSGYICDIPYKRLMIAEVICYTN